MTPLCYKKNAFNPLCMVVINIAQKIPRDTFHQIKKLFLRFGALYQFLQVLSHFTSCFSIILKFLKSFRKSVILFIEREEVFRKVKHQIFLFECCQCSEFATFLGKRTKRPVISSLNSPISSLRDS